MEDGQRLDEFLKVNDLVLLHVKGIKYLVWGMGEGADWGGGVIRRQSFERWFISGGKQANWSSSYHMAYAIKCAAINIAPTLPRTRSANRLSRLVWKTAHKNSSLWITLSCAYTNDPRYCTHRLLQHLGEPTKFGSDAFSSP